MTEIEKITDRSNFNKATHKYQMGKRGEYEAEGVGLPEA